MPTRPIPLQSKQRVTWPIWMPGFEPVGAPTVPLKAQQPIVEVGSTVGLVPPLLEVLVQSAPFFPTSLHPMPANAGNGMKTVAARCERFETWNEVGGLASSVKVGFNAQWRLNSMHDVVQIQSTRLPQFGYWDKTTIWIA